MAAVRQRGPACKLATRLCMVVEALNGESDLLMDRMVLALKNLC